MNHQVNYKTMKKPNYNDILKGKIEYYGDTKAAYELAASVYANRRVLYRKIYGTSGELLKKYIDHVRDCEGIDFIDRIHDYRDSVHFTESEIEILKSLTK